VSFSLRIISFVVKVIITTLKNAERTKMTQDFALGRSSSRCALASFLTLHPCWYAWFNEFTIYVYL